MTCKVASTASQTRRTASESANHSSLIRALEARFDRRERLQTRSVQKNFRDARVRLERRDTMRSLARSSCSRMCTFDRDAKQGVQKAPIPSAFLASMKIRSDVGARKKDSRAHTQHRRDERGAMMRERVVIVHPSSTRFGFFRLLRY
jgi:hypothetical protein